MGRKIFLVGLQVLGNPIDSLSQQSNLALYRTGIGSFTTKICKKFHFFLFCQIRHLKKFKKHRDTIPLILGGKGRGKNLKFEIFIGQIPFNRIDWIVIRLKSESLKKIYFSVTNDLVYDQRMSRICGSLSNAGFLVTLVGRKSRKSPPLEDRPYRQVRWNCWFQKGKFFYFEFNLRLFFYLAFQKADALCCIDLDTILPNLLVSKLKNIPRVYDAHELFCEMKEIIRRPLIHACWKTIERITVPAYKNGYTVSEFIAKEFKKMYAVDYSIIRNFPLLSEFEIPVKTDKFILYQGSVNEGRSFESLIPAMKEVESSLVICGDGNFINQTRQLVKENNLEKSDELNLIFHLEFYLNLLA